MPGSLMDCDKRPDPCMPTPIMPKRTRSLAGPAPGGVPRSYGNGTIVFAASEAPAATALVPRNSRRDQLVFFTAPPMPGEWTGKQMCSIGPMTQRRSDIAANRARPQPDRSICDAVRGPAALSIERLRLHTVGDPTPPLRTIYDQNLPS